MSVNGLDGKEVVVACHVSCSSLQGFDPFSFLVFVFFFDASECKSVKPHSWQTESSTLLKIWLPHLGAPLKKH